MMASRSTAIDTARRNTGLLNQAYFTGSTSVADPLPGGRLFAVKRRLDLVQVEPEESVLISGPRL